MDQAALARRYGDRWDFARLSERQRALLLDDSLYAYRSGNHQVWITEIGTEGDRPVLRLNDTLYYLFHRSRVNPVEHSGKRIPVYKEVLRVSEDPVETERNTYLFDLQESGQVSVKFGSVKDTV